MRNIQFAGENYSRSTCYSFYATAPGFPVSFSRSCQFYFCARLRLTIHSSLRELKCWPQESPTQRSNLSEPSIIVFSTLFPVFSLYFYSSKFVALAALISRIPSCNFLCIYLVVLVSRWLGCIIWRGCLPLRWPCLLHQCRFIVAGSLQHL